MSPHGGCKLICTLSYRTQNPTRLVLGPDEKRGKNKAFEWTEVANIACLGRHAWVAIDMHQPLAPHAAIYWTSKKRPIAWLLTVATILSFFRLVSYIGPQHGPLMDHMLPTQQWDTFAVPLRVWRADRVRSGTANITAVNHVLWCYHCPKGLSRWNRF